jgi:hypothetical protein
MFPVEQNDLWLKTTGLENLLDNTQIIFTAITYWTLTYIASISHFYITR